MAVFNSYSVFDIKSVTFGVPFFSVNEATARRDFCDLASDPSTTVCRHKEDFRLYFLGTFDSGTGRFSPCDIPHFVCDALEFSRDYSSDSPSSDSRVSDFTFGGFRDDED